MISNFKFLTYSRVEKKKEKRHIVKKRIQNKNENKNINITFDYLLLGHFTFFWDILDNRIMF